MLWDTISIWIGLVFYAAGLWLADLSTAVWEKRMGRMGDEALEAYSYLCFDY